jgi:DNA-directed RNA polymerase specialized sigma24 family protein
MLSTRMENRLPFASCEDVHRVFKEFRAELEWLAYFITGDQDAAAACVVDAGGLSQSHHHVFEEWLLHWARYATIRLALRSQKPRIDQLSNSYAQSTCVHEKHDLLSADLVELLMIEAGTLVSRLDVISRAVLVICGIEKHSVSEAALLLGVSSACVRAAYCRGLQSLDVLRWEQFTRKHEYASMCA